MVHPNTKNSDMVYCIYVHVLFLQMNSIGGIMVSMLPSSAVDRGFEPRSGQTKDNKIGICCFSGRLATLRRNSKDCLARKQNNMSE